MDILVGLHSLWRWVVLIVVLVAIVRGLAGWLRGGEWTGADRGLAAAATGAVDLQVLLGIIIWIVERRWNDGVFLGVIHPLVMLIALGVAHAGSIMARRAIVPPAKYRALAVSLLITMVLVTAAIPSYAWSRVWR